MSETASMLETRVMAGHYPQLPLSVSVSACEASETSLDQFVIGAAVQGPLETALDQPLNALGRLLHALGQPENALGLFVIAWGQTVNALKLLSNAQRLPQNGLGASVNVLALAEGTDLVESGTALQHVAPMQGLFGAALWLKLSAEKEQSTEKPASRQHRQCDEYIIAL